MDYKGLISRLRASNMEHLVSSEETATAIETLLAERDAPVEMLRMSAKPRCLSCTHGNCGIKDFPCFDCKDNGGFIDRWEWRLEKKENLG